MRLQAATIFVDDQAHAADFYTRVLGFEVTADVPLGEARWLTVAEPGNPGATNISLEPKGHPAAVAYAAALLEDGIPCCQLGVADLAAEHERLTALGVVFTQPPTDFGPVTVAVLDDTCGNLLQLAQVNAQSEPGADGEPDTSGDASPDTQA
ncbi:VOC family protein [Miniimonas arenae]|uniref:VOC family protein n=1 Tax=Miniimonas arenae TaxID=676201 RepID=A0A5C5BBE4_9MICO|nr:VOC family protein [Miniimonas arenae]TNU73196.1 VOC family protein [Miniimonas arenae]